MPYLFMIGVLALWLLPVNSMAAESSSSSKLAISQPAANAPADYPEDFSRPATFAAAQPDYTDAFGEEDESLTPPASDRQREDLMRPLDAPREPSPVPAEVPRQK